MRDVRRFGFKQFGMREHDAKLVVQLVKQRTELRIGSEILHARADRAALLRRMPRRDRVRHMRTTISVRARRPVRVAPQRIGEDANRSARRPDVFHFSGGNPVVDGAPADADRFTGLHDRKCLSVHKFGGQVSGVALVQLPRLLGINCPLRAPNCSTPVSGGSGKTVSGRKHLIRKS